MDWERDGISIRGADRSQASIRSTAASRWRTTGPAKAALTSVGRSSPLPSRPTRCSSCSRRRLDVGEDSLEPVGRELAGPVLVHVDDLSRRHVHAGYAHRHVHGVDRHAPVAGGNPAQQVLEAGRAYLVHVTRRAVGNGPDAADRPHRGGHVAAGPVQPCRRSPPGTSAGTRGPSACWTQSRASTTFHEGQPGVVGVRQPEDAGYGVAHRGPQLGNMQRIDWSVYQFSVHGL